MSQQAMDPMYTYEGEVLRVGTTAERTMMTARGEKIPVGWQYYDTTLDRPLWWDGAAWRHADGTSPA